MIIRLVFFLPKKNGIRKCWKYYDVLFPFEIVDGLEFQTGTPADKGIVKLILFAK